MKHRFLKTITVSLILIIICSTNTYAISPLAGVTGNVNGAVKALGSMTPISNAMVKLSMSASMASGVGSPSLPIPNSVLQQHGFQVNSSGNIDLAQTFTSLYGQFNIGVTPTQYTDIAAKITALKQYILNTYNKQLKMSTDIGIFASAFQDKSVNNPRMPRTASGSFNAGNILMNYNQPSINTYGYQSNGSYVFNGSFYIKIDNSPSNDAYSCIEFIFLNSNYSNLGKCSQSSNFEKMQNNVKGMRFYNNSWYYYENDAKTWMQTGYYRLYWKNGINGTPSYTAFNIKTL